MPVGLVAAVVGSIAAEQVPGDGHLLQLPPPALLGLSSYRMGRAPAPLPPEEPLAETDAPEAPAGAPEGSRRVLPLRVHRRGRRRRCPGCSASAAA